MNHGIPEDVANSVVDHCISEYVRNNRDQNVLREHWFNGQSFMALAEKHDLSLTTVKRIVYDEGDQVLRRATILAQNAT